MRTQVNAKQRQNKNLTINKNQIKTECKKPMGQLATSLVFDRLANFKTDLQIMMS
jgi:hypothetical protein